MLAFILNNKLTSFLIGVIFLLGMYNGYQTFKIYRITSKYEKSLVSIKELQEDLNKTIAANNTNISTINDLSSEVSNYTLLLKSAHNQCDNRIKQYKIMLKECQESFPETNSTVIHVSDCKVKVIDSNSSTLKILNSIGQ